MTNPGQVITFYSYKGGTGRTMALANAGTLLARRKDGEVLLMDWDLEAPGLHRYFEHDLSYGGQLGTIDLLEELASRVVGTGEQQMEEEATLALVRQVNFDKYVVSVEQSLNLLWAGSSDDEDYARRIGAFDWDNLYCRAPHLFTSLARVLAERYRYVLVDSRTGVSDTSGVCTALLPEKLVVVFTPNRQSLDGALSRARSAVAYRRQSNDLRSLVVYPLASRVELSEDELRRRWRHGEEAADEGYGNGNEGYQPRFEDLFCDIYQLPVCELQVWFDEVQIQQTTRYAYGEEVAVAAKQATSDRLSLAYSYASFTDALEETDAPWRLERRADTRREVDDEQERVAMERLTSECEWHHERSRRTRRTMLLLRLYQFSIALMTITALALIFLQTEHQNVWALVVAAGSLLLAGIEGVLVASGATQWRRHAALAELLTEEKYRYEARTRQYESATDRGKVLAMRVDEILAEAYRDWSENTPFGGLAPIPRRPDRPERARSG
jgi:eukaryotic-like serine/threonine-protein kinase